MFTMGSLEMCFWHSTPLRLKGFGKRRRREMEGVLLRLQLSFLFGRGKTNTLCEKSLPPGFALIFHVGAFWCKPDWVPKTGVQVSKTHFSKASLERVKKREKDANWFVSGNQSRLPPATRTSSSCMPPPPSSRCSPDIWNIYCINIWIESVLVI